MTRIPFILAAAMTLAAGCEPNPGPAPSPSPRFAAYYAGELVVTEKTRLESADTTVLATRLDSLRSRYGITLPERDSLLAWHRDSLPRWEALLREVLTRLDSSAAKEGIPRWTGGPVIPGTGVNRGGGDSTAR